MGSRLGGMKGGGGFLNNVDGTFVEYEFTHTFPGQTADPSQLFGVLTIRPDGAEEPVQTTLRFGSATYLTIQDSHTIVNPEGGAVRIWDKSDGFRFLESVEEAGLEDGGIDASDPSVLSFTNLIDRRMHFVQEPDEARMAARVRAGDNPKRVNKDTGKEYDFTRLIVTQVYDTVAEVQAKAATPRPRPVITKNAVAAKGVGKPAASPFVKGGRPNGVAVAASGEGDLGIEADSILTGIVEMNGGSVLRSDLTRLVTTRLLTDKNPRREPLRKLIYSPEFLTSRVNTVYDEASQTVALA